MLLHIHHQAGCGAIDRNPTIRLHDSLRENETLATAVDRRGNKVQFLVEKAFQAIIKVYIQYQGREIFGPAPRTPLPKPGLGVPVVAGILENLQCKHVIEMSELVDMRWSHFYDRNKFHNLSDSMY